MLNPFLVKARIGIAGIFYSNPDPAASSLLYTGHEASKFLTRECCDNYLRKGDGAAK